MRAFAAWSAISRPVPRRPVWWSWELEFSAHLLERMVDRNFTEVDLRRMFSDATGLRRDARTAHWVIETWHRGRRWEVIVEPEADTRVILVMTAYTIES
jgi:hypothetical protein